MIQRSLMRALACVALLAATSHVANAQNRLLLAAGIGQGSGWPTCDGCNGIDHRQGLTGFARVGAFVSSHASIALEGNRWVNSSSDADSQFQSLLAVAQFYASNEGGLSLKLGAGVGGSLIKFKDGLGDQISSTGFSYSAGLQYDFAITHRLSVSPFGDFLATAGAPESTNIGPASGSLNGNVVRFGVGLTWR